MLGVCTFTAYLLGHPNHQARLTSQYKYKVSCLAPPWRVGGFPHAQRYHHELQHQVA
jgi:hypothetical protein